jgi:hypothetical protein
MAKQPIITLKEYFETGKRPTQSQFEDLIDSFAHLDGAEVLSLINGIDIQGGNLRLKNTSNSVIAQIALQDLKTSLNVPTTFVESINGQSGAVNVPLGDSGWQNVTTFATNIVNYTTATELRYRKLNGVIFLDGAIKGGTAQTNGGSYHLFTLPSGFTPSRKMSVVVARANTSTTYKSGRIDIDTDGKAYGVDYSHLWTSLSGISFLAD